MITASTFESSSSFSYPSSYTLICPFAVASSLAHSSSLYTASKPGVVEITTRFYWPNEPPAAAGYTAPLVRFVETRITGLTTQPIVLTNYYSQTYRPGHHNFTEEFIFEPRLEPGLSAQALAELQAANIRFFHVHFGFGDTVINVLGFDGKMRSL